MSAPKPLKRTCDQCHSVNEKCRRLSDIISCERRDRLGQACRTTRNAAKARRKSQTSRKVTYALPSSAEIEPGGYYAGAGDPDSVRSSIISYDGKLASNSTISHDLDNWEIHFVNHMTSPSWRPHLSPSFWPAPVFTIHIILLSSIISYNYRQFSDMQL
jgi:hypothetical protein